LIEAGFGNEDFHHWEFVFCEDIECLPPNFTKGDLVGNAIVNKQVKDLAGVI